MNKKIIIVFAAISILVITSLAYVFSLPANNDEPPYAPITSDETAKPKTTSPSVKETGRNSDGYIEYSPEKIATTPGTKLLFFHAPWCSQCRQLEQSINENGLPKGLTVFKVDYDSHQELREKYGVKLQTTFVSITDSGEKIDSYVAYEQPRFESVERALLR